MRTAMTENASLCERMEKLTAFVELESTVREVSKKERRGVLHVLRKLAETGRRKDVGALPLRLYASVFWQEGVRQCVAKVASVENTEFSAVINRTRRRAHDVGG
jgi:hypothetical protein